MPLKCYKKGLVFLVAKTLSNAGHNDWPTTKIFEITLIKTPLNSPQKAKLGPKNKWFKTSYLEFIFYFRYSSRKSQSQQNAA